MDLLRTKIYLDKINREFARMSKDPDTVTRMDMDIMMAHLRDMYDALVSDPLPTPKPVAPPRQETARVVEQPAPPRVVVEAPPPAPAIAPPPPVVVEAPPPPPPVAPPPVAPPVETPPPVVTQAPPPPVVPAPPPAAAPAPVAPQPSASTSAEDAQLLFEQKEAKELSEKLAETPIADLKRAIALNDRLLLTRELFGGDNAFFDATLGSLNTFSGFEQAKSFLMAECIGRFAWTDKARIDIAKNFIKLVRRRYK